MCEEDGGNLEAFPFLGGIASKNTRLFATLVTLDPLSIENNESSESIHTVVSSRVGEGKDYQQSHACMHTYIQYNTNLAS